MKKIFYLLHKRGFLIFLFVFALYFSSHLINFSRAPWNQNGLFDDAAWDIYFAKNHVFTGVPFQIAYFDGGISREVTFHYYISIFFKLFGYNLLVFNISLLMLGFITVLFTTLIIRALFKNNFVTIISAVIINFLPLHFLHVFVGHRYAIAAPLMTISLFYLYTSFTDKSRFKAILSGFFAALCLESTIMGRQYLYGLVLTAVCLLICKNTRQEIRKRLNLIIVWVVSFTFAVSPLIIYVVTNPSLYNIRENGLIRDFFQKFQEGGLIGIQSYFNQIKEVFFANHTYRRWFLPDFYVIPLPYCIFLIPGLIIAWFKRRFEIVFLSLLPVIGAFIAGGYDFRVLLAAPIWVICMAFSLNWLSNRQRWIILAGVACLVLGLIPSIKYLWNVSKDPNYFWLLPHRDVAVSRLIQDIVVGVKNPTSKMKWNEFNRKVDTSAISYDTFAAPVSAYAIIHLYLQNFDDKKILSFIDQGDQLLSTPSGILDYNIKTIKSYSPTNKDLKLVWEISDKSTEVIKLFSRYNKYGKDEVISDSVDGNNFSVYILTINNKYLDKFKNEI